MNTVYISVNAGSAAHATYAVSDKLRTDKLDGMVVDVQRASDLRPDDKVAIVVTSDPVRATFLVAVRKGAPKSKPWKCSRRDCRVGNRAAHVRRLDHINNTIGPRAADDFALAHFDGDQDDD